MRLIIYLLLLVWWELSKLAAIIADAKLLTCTRHGLPHDPRLTTYFDNNACTSCNMVKEWHSQRFDVVGEMRKRNCVQWLTSGPITAKDKLENGEGHKRKEMGSKGNVLNDSLTRSIHNPVHSTA